MTRLSEIVRRLFGALRRGSPRAESPGLESAESGVERYRPALVPEWLFHLRLRWRTGDVLMVIVTVVVLVAVCVLFWSQIAAILSGVRIGGGASGTPPAPGGPLTP